MIQTLYIVAGKTVAMADRKTVAAADDGTGDRATETISIVRG